MERKAMFEVAVQDSFSSAHCLTHYAGKCERLHGHNWTVQIAVRGAQRDRSGCLIDFIVLKKALRDILEPLDHAFLNELEAFQSVSVSSEEIAQHIYKSLSPQIETDDLKIARVTVWEGPNSSATYFPSTSY